MKSNNFAMWTILTLSLMSTGCDNTADDLALLADGGLPTDGTGGGIETINNKGDTIITNVDYSHLVDEDKIGIPDNTGEVLRQSIINIDLKMDVAEMIAADADILDFSSFDPAFRPDTKKSFMIEDSNLVIKDSADNTYPIVIYMVPYQYGSTKITMAVFATINNLAYNSLSLNQSHTAFYLRGAYLGNTQIVSSYVWGKSNMVPTNENTTLPTSWVAGAATIEQGSTDILHTPSVTKYACYKAYSGTDCDSYDNDTNNNNKSFEKIMFQPIATVGYQNFDFFNFGFTDTTLAGLAVKSDYTEVQKTEYHNLALAQTKAKLEAEADVTQSDIGWYGLPITKRESIIRYHNTELTFTFTDDAGIVDGTTMKVSSIKLAHYTKGTNQSTTPVEILSGEKTLSLQNQTTVAE
ncbi:MAG: hypothetical protein ISP86_03285 [Shewanellaceae bacterium]|nr:hypothetical protein [Shewanellaceae bacterium]